MYGLANDAIYSNAYVDSIRNIDNVTVLIDIRQSK